MITINVDKAKDIAHSLRRAARAEEFKPYDDAAAAEQARKDIRAKYALIQDAIDIAATPDEIKAALGGI